MSNVEIQTFHDFCQCLQQGWQQINNNGGHGSINADFTRLNGGDIKIVVKVTTSSQLMKIKSS